jgi:hypothetical protein
MKNKVMVAAGALFVLALGTAHAGPLGRRSKFSIGTGAPRW